MKMIIIDHHNATIQRTTVSCTIEEANELVWFFRFWHDGTSIHDEKVSWGRLPNDNWDCSVWAVDDNNCLYKWEDPVNTHNKYEIVNCFNRKTTEYTAGNFVRVPTDDWQAYLQTNELDSILKAPWEEL